MSPIPACPHQTRIRALTAHDDRDTSKTMAALWMAGWLALMLVMAVAGREAMREMNVFQIMEVRSLLGFLHALSDDPRATADSALEDRRACPSTSHAI